MHFTETNLSVTTNLTNVEADERRIEPEVMDLIATHGLAATFSEIASDRLADLLDVFGIVGGKVTLTVES